MTDRLERAARRAVGDPAFWGDRYDDAVYEWGSGWLAGATFCALIVAPLMLLLAVLT